MAPVRQSRCFGKLRFKPLPGPKIRCNRQQKNNRQDYEAERLQCTGFAGGVPWYFLNGVSPIQSPLHIQGKSEYFLRAYMLEVFLFQDYPREER